jgi:hypothetical protein
MLAYSGRVLLRNRHYVLEERLGERIVVAVRNAVPFASQAEVDASCGELMTALDRFGRSTSALLMDSRLAPGRSDPSFEAWFAPYRGGMLVGFLRSAVLVQSAVGRLHTDRLLRMDNHPEAKVRSFVEEATALEWLREALPAR